MIDLMKSKYVSEMSKLTSCYACNSVRIRIAYDDSIYRVLRCSDCGLHFVNPEPTHKEVETHHSDILYKEGSDIIQIEKQKVRAVITTGEINKLFQKERLSGKRLLDWKTLWASEGKIDDKVYRVSQFPHIKTYAFSITWFFINNYDC